MNIFKINILFVLCVGVSDAAKILFVIPTPSINHQVVFRPLYLELVKKGHNVTVITTDLPFPVEKSPKNLTFIDFHDVSYGLWREKFISAHKGDKTDIQNQLMLALNLILKTNIIQLESKEVQDILKSKFDLLIIESCLRSFLAYSYFIKAPVIIMSSLGPIYLNLETVGAATDPILYPLIDRPKIYNLTNFEKLKEYYNVYTLYKLFKDFEYDETEALREVFGPEFPVVGELRKNVDLLMVNWFPIWDSNRPVPPGMLYIGGIHQQPRKELPKDLKDYLDSSINGVIYVSFGTNVDPSLLPAERIQVLIRTFSALPYNVLWKWSNDEVLEVSPNVKMSKWFPQSDLLRHPNIKVFITQGGLQSTDEAILAAVPLLGIPMLIDQWYNVQRYVQNGIGLQLELVDLTVDNLKHAIETLAEDTKYKRAIENFRTLVHDQPQPPLERAVWWTEYVIRHKGAKHLRAPAANMTWWEFYEMDLVLIVAAMLLPILAGIIFATFYIVKLIRVLLFSNNTKIKKQ